MALPYNKLQSYIKATSDRSKDVPLPLIHSTAYGVFRDFIARKCLVPKPNPVGNQEKTIICFFYGKAGYVVEKNKPNLELYEYYPVCIGLREDSVHFSGIYAFDTGAYSNPIDTISKKEIRVDNAFRELYPQHQNDDISLLELTPTLENLHDFINTFFGNEDKYLNDQIRELHTLIAPDADTEAPEHCTLKFYVKMFGLTQHKGLDDRIKCVEIQTDKTVPILPTNVEFICCPIEICDTIRKMGFNAIGYKSRMMAIDGSNNIQRELLVAAGHIIYSWISDPNGLVGFQERQARKR